MAQLENINGVHQLYLSELKKLTKRIRNYEIIMRDALSELDISEAYTRMATENHYGNKIKTLKAKLTRMKQHNLSLVAYYERTFPATKPEQVKEA